MCSSDLSSSVEALRLHTLKAALPQDPGGLVGAVISHLLSGILGFTGTTLVLLTVLGIGLSLFTGISWLTACEAVGLALERGYVLVRERWSVWQDTRAGEVAAVEREAVVEEKREQLIEEHEPIQITAPVVEIPKSPRVLREKQEQLFHDLPDTPLPPLKLLDDPPADVEVQSAETLEYTSRLKIGRAHV